MEAMGIVGLESEASTSFDNVKALTYMDWVQKVDSFLSLDISVNGSGYVLWYDGKLTLGRYSVVAKETSMRVEEYRRWLSNLVGGLNIQYIFVEDVIAGCNFKTTRELISLNGVIDSLIYAGVLPSPEALIRKNNKEWKAMLSTASGGTQFVHCQQGSIKGNDKELVRACLHTLQFNPEILTVLGYKSLKEQQDMYDALGMAVGVIAVDIEHVHLKKHKPVSLDIRKGYKIKQYSERADVDKAVKRLTSKVSRDIVEADLGTSGDRNILVMMEHLLEDNPTALFVVKAPVNKCCNILLLKGLEVSEEWYYLVIYK